MNTSDPFGFDSLPGGMPNVSSDLPDIELLTRLANEYFSAPPGASVPAIPPIADDLQASDPLNSLTGAGVPATGIGLPGEAELKALLASSESASTRPFGAGFDSSLMSSTPSFYFLETTPLAPTGLAVPGFETGFDTKDPLKAAQRVRAPFDVSQIRKDFPILGERVNGRPLVWLDNAATTQKPSAVIERLKYFYEHENSNIHRAAHDLAARSTDAYEGAREKVRRFLNAASTNEIVFARGATEAINLVAQSWGRHFIGEGDEIVVSWLEHHANIVPWQQLAAEKGAKLRVIPVDDSGRIILSEAGRIIGPKTKLVSVTQVSNALGTIVPVKQLVDMAHGVGAKALVDGAQAVSHMPADVQAIDADWYVFSGHKVFAPTGIGVLYGKEALLNQMQPWQGGGNMIADVTFDRTLYQNAPARFEAGTGNIADAVGLGAAIDYVTTIGMDRIAEYEHQLLLYSTRLLNGIPGLRIIGTAADKAGVLSFVLKGFKTEEVGAALNREGIAVRSGHHCAQPILRRFGVESSVRPSLAFYNTCADVDAMISVLERLSSGRAWL